MRLAWLHGNLVVRFHNAHTGRYFYSFLGGNEVAQTAGCLLQASREEGLPVELRLVPEESAVSLRGTEFLVEEDRAHFDYLLNLQELSEYRGSRYDVKRWLANKFHRLNGVKVELLDLRSDTVICSIAQLCDRWQENKGLESKEIVQPGLYGGGGDVAAIERLIPHIPDFGLLTIGIWNGCDLTACCIAEVMHAQHAMIHFMKADVRNFPGSYESLMQYAARELLRDGCSIMNGQEDLGIPSLRDSKLSYRPCGFLKKFSIRLPRISGAESNMT